MNVVLMGLEFSIGNLGCEALTYAFIDELEKIAAEENIKINYQCIVLIDSPEIILPVEKERINIIRGNYPSFDLEYENYILINENTIFDIKYNPKKVKYKSIYKNAVKISKYDELCVGDYVVHYDHGIG